MMQISLTPAESKKLIAKSLMELDYLREALKNGIVLVHPSSTTYFLYQEITGTLPSENWVCGVVVQKGACINRDMLDELIIDTIKGVSKYPFWIFEKGKLLEKFVPISKLVEMMGEGDVYVKTGNAVDCNGNVGVLVGAPDGKGTVGKLYEASKKKGFRVLIPIGLEKLIPSVEVASRTTNPAKVRYSTGMPLKLFPIKGHVVTEIEAVFLLTGAKATPIAGGGLSGAEGSMTLVVEGSDEQLELLKKIVLEIKGTELPKVYVPDCEECTWKTCSIYDFENLSRCFK
ncbi:MAG: hypothetical protein DRG59_10045 [Deltaproteobacteria bacterium]|nr:MAG: hypothetical protein DRG59_10045 [Deltaproteobacteria bacterium]